MRSGPFKRCVEVLTDDHGTVPIYAPNLRHLLESLSGEVSPELTILLGNFVVAAAQWDIIKKIPLGDIPKRVDQAIGDLFPTPVVWTNPSVDEPMLRYVAVAPIHGDGRTSIALGRVVIAGQQTRRSDAPHVQLQAYSLDSNNEMKNTVGNRLPITSDMLIGYPIRDMVDDVEEALIAAELIERIPNETLINYANGRVPNTITIEP